jgi:mannose-6-phosphate isomerase-like protein (cupin superfamily)
MTPERFSFSTRDESIRERVVDRPDRWNVLIAHVVLPSGEAVLAHPTDSEAFVTVVRGTLSMALDGVAESQHPRGSVLYLPKGTSMAPRNEGSEVLEFFVVKTPHPQAASKP